MIEKDRDGYQKLACDECGDEQKDDFAPDDFTDMIASAKADKWKIAPDEDAPGGWSHTCPACSTQSRLDKALKLFGKNPKPVREKRDLL